MYVAWYVNSAVRSARHHKIFVRANYLGTYYYYFIGSLFCAKTTFSFLSKYYLHKIYFLAVFRNSKKYTWNET